MLSILVAGSPAGASELTFDLKIEHGRAPGTMHPMRVRQGDVVRLRWTSDRPLTLHLHGYDIEMRVPADAVGEHAFTADATGRFPIEIHMPAAGTGGRAHAGAPLAIIEVYPR